MAEEKDIETTLEKIKTALSAPGEHACRNDPEGMCPVTSINLDALIAVTNKKYLSCPEYMPFGYGGFCKSALRREIYEKHNR